ncbi:MAG: hypothetical protein IPN63_07080 [Gammaproteobacteria bacterium]|nr:hypothetical protein [Gammaproteobacteria bacterium]
MANPAPRPLTESPAGAASFTFGHLSDPHLSTPAPLPPRDWCSKRALGYLSWYRKRRFEHRTGSAGGPCGATFAQTRPDHW